MRFYFLNLLAHVLFKIAGYVFGEDMFSPGDGARANGKRPSALQPRPLINDDEQMGASKDD